MSDTMMAQSSIDNYDITPFDLNSIEPAAGEILDEKSEKSFEEEDPDIITQKLMESLSTLSTLEYGER